MEVENKVKETKVKFCTLNTGDVFLDENGNAFMVVDEDYGIGKDYSYEGYAVEFKTGWLYGFEEDEKVVKVTGKVTITN